MVYVKRAALLMVLLVLYVPCRPLAQTGQSSSVQKQIFGTWKLVSYVREEVASGAKSDVMGAHPQGYISYGPDGRMIVMIAASDRKKPVGPVATPDEAEALIRSMLAYAGSYTIDSESKTISHQIDVSWDQSRTGGSFVRQYNLDGDRLTLTTEPSNDPATGTKTIRRLSWEKVRLPAAGSSSVGNSPMRSPNPVEIEAPAKRDFR
jgi:hypothetical protein